MNLGSLRMLASTALAIMQTRLELFATELEEAGVRVGCILVYAVSAFFFLGFGVVLFAVFMTVVLWDSHRLLVLGVLTAIFFVVGVASALFAMHSARHRSPLFAASLAEFKEDRKALFAHLPHAEQNDQH